jgi:peptide/nickel transport system permease protein
MQASHSPKSLSMIAWGRLRRNPIGMGSLGVVGIFLVTIVASAFGWIAQDWDTQYALSFAPPTFLGAPAQDLQDESNPVFTQINQPKNIEMYGLQDPLEPELQALRNNKLRAEDAALSASEQTERNAGLSRAHTLMLGADKWGRSVVLKVVKGAETSVMVGIASALLATAIGTLLGAFAGYLGKAVDAVIEWLYGVFTAIPYLLLVFAIAAVLQQKGVITIILILGLTGWTGVYRLIRAEYIKHKTREYVQAAEAIGATHARRMFVHILPNVSHVILVQLSQQVVNFIKAEVILSFLGFGVPVDVVSWGSILNETPNELILGYGWQLIVCGLAMAILVTAFAMLTDALRDALDPRLK